MVLSLYEIDWIKRASKNLPERKKEEVNELSKETLQSYINARKHQASGKTKWTPPTDSKVAINSKKGRILATKKIMAKEETVNEKWGNNYETPKSKRGMFKGRSLSSLEKEAGHVSGTKAKQVNFAIRAKKAHGGKWKGVTAEGEEMTNNYEAMIVAAVEKKPDDFTQAFEAAIQEKLQGHVAGFKEYLQTNLLGDEPVAVAEEETVDEGEAVDIDEVFELFLDQHNEGTFATLEDAVIAFAKEVELTEEEAAEYYDYLTQEPLSEEVKDIVTELSLEEGYPTKKHFQQVADVVKNIKDDKERSSIAHHHAQIFKGQNSRFDHNRFMTACGVK